jgi:hypothetical protein
MFGRIVEQRILSDDAWRRLNINMRAGFELGQ